MRIFVNENVDKEYLERDVNFLLALIAKEISDYTKIFLSEKKLIKNIKKSDILKKYKLSNIEIIEDLDENISYLQIKENIFKKDTLLIFLGKDFFEKFLTFIQTQKEMKGSTFVDPYHYTLRIVKLVLKTKLYLRLKDRLTFDI